MPGESARQDTLWTLVASAAQGDEAARARFFHTYQPLVHAYLLERWRNSPLQAEVEDAAQDVFVECFKDASPLARAEPGGPGSFRAYLVGIVRHVAQRAERRAANRPAPAAVDELDEDPPDRATRLSCVVDREWARVLVGEARSRMEQRAQALGPEALRRVELLALRFGEGLPIREIAERWSADPARLHHDFARAREEFGACLRSVVAENAVRSEADLDAECERVLALLG
jgi:RNA polymerase sigma factor (sigma-70 family)